MGTIDYRDFDRDIWESDLEDFVPSVVYDMHTHMWSEAHKGTLTGPPTGLRWEIDYQDHLGVGGETLSRTRDALPRFGNPYAGAWMQRGTTTGWRRRWQRTRNQK